MEFTEAVERHLAAVGQRDLAGFLATVHDDVSVVLLNGRLVAGRPAVAEFHREWFADPDWSWQLAPVRLATAGDTAVAVYQVTYHDLDQHGQPYELRYLLSLSFTRQAGTWLLLHDQNTATPAG